MITINHPSVQTEGNAVTISYPILQDGHAPRTCTTSAYGSSPIS